MPLTRRTFLGLCLVGALATSCGGDTEPGGVPPTEIDLGVPIEDLVGWTDLKSSIGEPPESHRLEDYLEFWRESLDAARRNPDPVARQADEEGWWDEAERALTSMIGAENAQTVLAWMETTFHRRGGGGS